MKLLLVLNLLILTVKIQAYQRKYPDRLSEECHLGEISIEETILTLRHGFYLDGDDLKRNLICFSYKIGMVDDYGEINVDFIKDTLKRGADEVIDICEKDSDDYIMLADINHKFMICLQNNLPVALSLL